MTKILVTGATGNIGELTLKHLLKRVPAGALLGLARDPSKAAELAAKGVEIRQGDYMDRDSLDRAFEGVDKIMLVSAPAFTDRNAQHKNVIDAAEKAGVSHVVYMPIVRNAGSDFAIPQVTADDLFAEEQLEASGLAYTLVGHPPFMENLQSYAGGNPIETGVIAPTGSGKAGYATRSDLAEAHAVVLTEAGHEGKSYSLLGSPAVSFADLARILSEIGDKPVPLKQVSDEDYIAQLVSVGLPEPAAAFVLTWVHGVNAGEWDGQTGDLAKLLGRAPTTPNEFLRSVHATLPTEAI